MVAEMIINDMCLPMLYYDVGWGALRNYRAAMGVSRKLNDMGLA